jgi:transposase
VISGIFHVLKSGCRWCDCPADYGPSTTVYNRFNRWSRRGFWTKLLDALVEAGAVTKSTSIDSTYIEVQRSAFGGKGAPGASDRRSRGGWTTKVHALTDVLGRPYALMLTAGNISDVKAAPTLLERAGRMRYLLGDKGYDSNSLRKILREGGTSPVIPGRRNRKRAVRYDQKRYRDRHLIENAFCRIKDFRRSHSLRQARRKFSVRRRPRNRARLLAVIVDRAATLALIRCATKPMWA